MFLTFWQRPRPRGAGRSGVPPAPDRSSQAAGGMPVLPVSRMSTFPAGVFAVLFLLCAGCGAEVPASAPAEKPRPKAATTGAPPAAPAKGVELVWPTPNHAYLEGRGIEAFIQPTVSGEVTSGLFGSVRSGGRQFHEGLDLFPLERDRRGEPADTVVAALAGVVRHVSTTPGASSYGRYIVLEHPEQSPAVYTLYAHLERVAPGIVPGLKVAAGTPLALMGHSSGGYTIPKERAHLHFEVGLRMTDDFQAWYKRRGFGSPNEQGLYNGMNLMGIDPLEMFARFRAGGLKGLDQIFRELPAALTLRIAHPGEPDFIRRYPSLLANRDAVSPAAGAGWEIDFSVTGLPLRWRRLDAPSLAGWKRDEVRMLAVNQELLAANRGRKLVETSRGAAAPAADLRTVLEQLFDWR